MSLNKIIQKSIQNSRIRNILDNSDFTNPVNQRRKTTYTSTNRGYTIDRWIANASLTLNVNTNTITALSSGNSQNEFYQIIANSDSLLGKVITFAIKTDTGIFLTNVTIPSSFTESWTIIGTADTDFGQIRVQMSDNSLHMILAVVAVNSGASVTIHWAALYEGEYNAETLPDYWPKGHAAEELECKRYFGRIDSWSSVPGVIQWEGKLELTVPYPVRMRINPIVTVAKGSIIVDGEYININETPSRTISYYGYINVFFDTAITGNHKSRPVIFVPSDISLDFNADL